MYKHYYINNNQTLNPGLHHEVHTKEHAAQLGIAAHSMLAILQAKWKLLLRQRKSILMRTDVQPAVRKHIGGN